MWYFNHFWSFWEVSPISPNLDMWASLPSTRIPQDLCLSPVAMGMFGMKAPRKMFGESSPKSKRKKHPWNWIALKADLKLRCYHPIGRLYPYPTAWMIQNHHRLNFDEKQHAFAKERAKTLPSASSKTTRVDVVETKFHEESATMFFYGHVQTGEKILWLVLVWL